MTQYKVTRWCCLSGMCLDCRAEGDKSKRRRVVQADKLDPVMAERYLRGWKHYEPKMEVMDPQPAEGRESAIQ